MTEVTPPPTDEEVRENVIRYGKALETSPLGAILTEINRTAGHVTWLGMKVREAPSDNMLLTDYRSWLQLYQQERRHLVRTAGEAVKLGLAEREVQVMEAQITLVAHALERVLGRLELSPEQRAAAPRLLREELLAIEAVGREVA